MEEEDAGHRLIGALEDRRNEEDLAEFGHLLGEGLALERVVGPRRLHVHQTQLRILRPLEEVVVAHVRRRIVDLIWNTTTKKGLSISDIPGFSYRPKC